MVSRRQCRGRARDRPDHHIMHGTKIFSAGTKVYISSEWADTRTIGGSFKVIGRARKSHRLVCAWLRWDRMENVRLRRVFSPAVLRIMAKMSRQTGEVDPSGSYPGGATAARTATESSAGSG